MSKPAIAIAAAVGLLGFARLLHAAADGAPTPHDALSRALAEPEPTADAEELEQRTSPYLRGWRLALTQRLADGEPDAQDDDGEGDQPVAATTFAPEADFRIDGLNYRVCGSGDDSCEWPETIIHANGALHVRVWVTVPGWPSVDRPIWLYALDGTRTGTMHFDDSAFFAHGMTLANDWFYLLSSVSNIRPRRICAYTLQGQRVEPSDSGRYC